MLYKKYHRNYVRQFRKGTEFVYSNMHDGITLKIVVEVEPWLYDEKIYVTEKFGNWTLVFPGGKINYEIKIEKDAIQEIS